MPSHPIRAGSPQPLTQGASPPVRSGGHGPTAREGRKRPIMDPELLGAVVQAVRIGFVLLLFALLLYASGIIR
jgi:hypothetical protein